jgi:serine/threonine protein kinase
MYQREDAIIASLLKLHNIVPDQDLREAIFSYKRHGEPDGTSRLEAWLKQRNDVSGEARQHLQDPQHIIAGYTLWEKIGEGQWGIVYKARQHTLKRWVAIKILYPDLAHSPAVDRFLREIEMLGQLHHPNILHALDAGTAGKLPYLVMEYFEGSTLAQYVRGHGPLSQKEALLLGHKLASALAHIWEHNILHRNIMPENIMVSRGELKIAELGLARELMPGSLLTSYALPARAFSYLSPEQLRGEKDLDYRSDVYALGAVIYYALTGRPPRENRDSNHSCRHENIAIVPLDTGRKIHNKTVNLLMRMLSPERTARCHTIEEIPQTFVDLSQNPEITMTTNLSLLRFSGKHLAWLMAFLLLSYLLVAQVMPEIYSRIERERPLRKSNLSPAAVYEKCAAAVVIIESTESLGSGVMLHHEDKRLLLTSQHVVKDARGVKVTLQDGRTFTAGVVHSDRESDLAALTLPEESRDMVTLSLADMRHVCVGDDVFVIGHPKGYRWSLTRGTVSGIRGDTLQTDAAIYPGNSGGPLLDSQGHVAGIVTFLVGSSNPIGFAISAMRISKFLHTLDSNRWRPQRAVKKN